ncbi:pentatricopeptide repeat-containing protein isoform X1 [Gossypium australe]|uniref:Pentatricopeptide repeat-containing protein isoform X1 n=1 Tax=Gossypium australe TaxID=47621 RepID=A0A5B6UL12_9ROSI|nr:pentatricopeptide repeat-containing protein isoform X1 [Gossypium australe]
MTNKRVLSRHLFFKTRRAVTTSAALPLDPSYATVSSIPADHFSLCLSFSEQLINRGLLSSARKLFQRVFSNSSPVSDALSTVDFVISRGLDLDLSTYAVLIKKLVQSGHLLLALSFYSDYIIGRARWTSVDGNVGIKLLIPLFCWLQEQRAKDIRLGASGVLLKTCQKILQIPGFIELTGEILLHNHVDFNQYKKDTAAMKEQNNVWNKLKMSDTRGRCFGTLHKTRYLEQSHHPIQANLQDPPRNQVREYSFHGRPKNVLNELSTGERSAVAITRDPWIIMPNCR